MGEISESAYRRARITGLLGSGGSTLVLFLFLFFSYLVTPIPPYPEGGGGGGMDVEVNLGYAEEGFGVIQPYDVAMPDFTNQVSVDKSPAVSQPEETITQESEETAVITKPPKVKPRKKEVKPVQPKIENKQPQKPQPAVEKPRLVNKSALYRASDKTSNPEGQGITKGETDQGSLTGQQSSNVYGPGGSGGGGSGGGSGGGTGKGSGSGIGNGIGPGVSYNLIGRTTIVLQKPEFSIQREGIVVVEVTVNRQGQVISATPGVKGSTIVDNTLYASAKKAALGSKFNLKNDAPDRQVGTITYHFKLQ
jgi:outer membrane biosynthesis protein TonB